MNSIPDPNRRKFLKAAGLAVGACVLCPHQLFAMGAGPGNLHAPVELGVVANFPTDQVYMQFERVHGIIVVRKAGQLFAMSAACPHRNTPVDLDSSPSGDTFECPTHGSLFDVQGRLLEGPSKTGLPRFKIFVNPQGVIVVDPGTIIPEADWASIGAFLPV